jgi:RNA polymerase sigma-70 factor (ECF subfamily)
LSRGLNKRLVNTSDYSRSLPVEILYCDHHDWLRGWLRRRLGNAADAADLAHDAFLRLITRPASRGFDSSAEARGYLRAMAQGLCINLWHRREIERAWLDTLAAQPEDYAPSVERQAIVLEALREIGALLLDVPPKAARAFLMSAVCEACAPWARALPSVRRMAGASWPSTTAPWKSVPGGVEKQGSLPRAGKPVSRRRTFSRRSPPTLRGKPGAGAS